MDLVGSQAKPLTRCVGRYLPQLGTWPTADGKPSLSPPFHHTSSNPGVFKDYGCEGGENERFRREGNGPLSPRYRPIKGFSHVASLTELGSRAHLRQASVRAARFSLPPRPCTCSFFVCIVCISVFAFVHTGMCVCAYPWIRGRGCVSAFARECLFLSAHRHHLTDAEAYRRASGLRQPRPHLCRRTLAAYRHKIEIGRGLPRQEPSATPSPSPRASALYLLPIAKRAADLRRQ